LLGAEAANPHPAERPGVGLAGVRLLTGEVVGLAEHDGLDQIREVEVVRSELRCQHVEQPGMAGWVPRDLPFFA